MINDLWPELNYGISNLTYISNRCLFENEGESIVKERFPLWLDKIFDMSNEDLRAIHYGPANRTREENFSKALKWYLFTYHSDYRWQIKEYYKRPEDDYYGIIDFRGTIMHILNFRGTGQNFLVYGAPRHEYFYGRFNSEFFHQVCHFDT